MFPFWIGAFWNTNNSLYNGLNTHDSHTHAQLSKSSRKNIRLLLCRGRTHGTRIWFWQLVQFMCKLNGLCQCMERNRFCRNMNGTQNALGSCWAWQWMYWMEWALKVPDKEIIRLIYCIMSYIRLSASVCIQNEQYPTSSAIFTLWSTQTMQNNSFYKTG